VGSVLVMVTVVDDGLRLIDIDIFVSCNWVDTRWQYTFTHTQFIEHHN
jgi:hypothetical protein